MAFNEIIRRIKRKLSKKSDMQLLRERALEIAVNEIGKGESGSNNNGPDVVKYRYGKDTGGSWCAAFVSWCYNEAAKELGMNLPFSMSFGARRLKNNIGDSGSFVEKPKPGDVGLIDRGVPGSWQAHIFIFSKFINEKENEVEIIEGNVGRFPALVRRWTRDLDEEKFLGWASIEKKEDKE